MKNSTITVVGGGMVGLAGACLLAREGFPVVVVDGGAPPSRNASNAIGRVSALNLATRHLLAHVGLWETITKERCTPYQAMSVWDSDSAARIQFHSREEKVPALGYIIENDLLTHVMWDCLHHNYQVKLRYGVCIRGLTPLPEADHAIRLELADGECIDSALVVAADGSQSILRSLASIGVIEQDFFQDAVTATIATTRPHQFTAYQAFTPQGPIAMLPLDGNCCSLVWSRDRDPTDDLLDLDETEFCRRLEQHFGSHLGSLHLVGGRRRFPLGSQHAKRYASRRLVLVGDAAHTVHPLAGLGANLGMLDVAALVETVTAARDAGKGIGNHSILRRYERWRQGENGIAIQAMKGFKNLFGSNHPLLRYSRQSGFRVANHIHPLKHWLAQYALGTRGDLPRVCLPPDEEECA